MLDITIRLEGEHNRILDGFADKYNHQPPEKKEDFLKRRWIEYVMEAISGSEVSRDVTIAEQNAKDKVKDEVFIT